MTNPQPKQIPLMADDLQRERALSARNAQLIDILFSQAEEIRQLQQELAMLRAQAGAQAPKQ